MWLELQPQGQSKEGPEGPLAGGQRGPAVSCPHRLKENYILLSTDGPGRNVLKFKPPMCFSLDNAQHVVAKLDAILTGEFGAQHFSRIHLGLVARTSQQHAQGADG